MNPYDGKDFVITAGANKGENMLAPVDGSIAPIRIAGVPRGRNNRYDLDPRNTGNAADYVQGPMIGAEADQLDALRAKGDLSPVMGVARMPLADAPSANMAPPPSGSDTDTGGGTPSQPPVASAPSPAPTGPGNDTSPSDPTPKPALSVAPAAPAGTVKAPASGITLTPAQHAKSQSLADDLEEHIRAIGGSVAAKFHALRALLGHYL